MRKDVGLILAAAVCFDLGVVVVPVHAAGDNQFHKDHVLKIDNLDPNQEYLKIKMTEVLISSKACQSDKGKLVDFKGTLYCAKGSHMPAGPLLKK